MKRFEKVRKKGLTYRFDEKLLSLYRLESIVQKGSEYKCAWTCLADTLTLEIGEQYTIATYTICRGFGVSFQKKKLEAHHKLLTWQKTEQQKQSDLKKTKMHYFV